jgi:uncharacterized protein YbbK (DUF523 family)
MGLPTPRESMLLVGAPQEPRLIAPKSGADYTEQMKFWAKERLDQLEPLRLSGFVLKKDSPSSGLFRVKVYNEHGMAERAGTGMFPRALMERFPLLPMEEEGRLNDMPLRENFIESLCLLSLDQDARRGADARRPGEVSHGPQARSHGP